MPTLCQLILAAVLGAGAMALAQEPWSAFTNGQFAWKSSGQLLEAGVGKNAADPWVAVKDPSAVFNGGRWHLFTTVRMQSGRVDIEYLNFTDWALANQAPRRRLACTKITTARRRCFKATRRVARR